MRDELVEVIDDKFKVLGLVPRKVSIKKNLKCKIAIIIVRDRENKVYIAQRAATKEIYPLKWSASAGGGVRPKESFEQAAKRELKEELGITAPVTFLFDFDFVSECSNYKAKVFEAKYNGRITLDKKECAQGKWATIEELKTLKKKGLLCPDTAIFIEKYLKLKKLDGVATKYRQIHNRKNRTTKKAPFRRPLFSRK